MVSTVGRKKILMREKGETSPLPENEEIDSEEQQKEEEIIYQIALNTEWIEGLMQRIQQSLISHTPLIMCEKDLEALNFMMLATSCSDTKTILEKINEIESENNTSER